MTRRTRYGLRLMRSRPPAAVSSTFTNRPRDLMRHGCRDQSLDSRPMTPASVSERSSADCATDVMPAYHLPQKGQAYGWSHGNASLFAGEVTQVGPAYIISRVHHNAVIRRHPVMSMKHGNKPRADRLIELEEGQRQAASPADESPSRGAHEVTPSLRRGAR